MILYIIVINNHFRVTLSEKYIHLFEGETDNIQDQMGDTERISDYSKTSNSED